MISAIFYGLLFQNKIQYFCHIGHLTIFFIGFLVIIFLIFGQSLFTITLFVVFFMKFQMQNIVFFCFIKVSYGQNQYL